MTHFLYCPFTGLGLHDGYRGDEWLKNRLKIFKQFVIPSLFNQTNKNFILWISWRPEEQKNKIVQDFAEWLYSYTKLKWVFTYEGLCFWDDKYPDGVAASRLTTALTETLPRLRQYVAGEVFMTIQPSDDIYLNTMVESVQNFKGHSGYRQGYIMQYASKELAEYNPTTQPPFYTIYFKENEFLNPDNHPRNKSHEYIRLGYSMGSRGFIVGTHGENISTVFNHPYKGRTITGDERNEILEQAGILDVAPLDIKKMGLRLWSRIVLNKLPFQKQLRIIYHKCSIKPF